METFDAANEGVTAAAADASAAATEPFSSRVAVSTDGFVSRAVADPAVVQFLGMRPNTAAVAAVATVGSGSGNASRNADCNLTLRDALRELVGKTGRGGMNSARPSSRRSRLCWGDIEALLFEPYDPTEVWGNPPSSVSIGAASTCSGGKQQEEKEDEDEEEVCRVRDIHCDFTVVATARRRTPVGKQRLLDVSCVPQFRDYADRTLNLALFLFPFYSFSLHGLDDVPSHHRGLRTKYRCAAGTFFIGF